MTSALVNGTWHALVAGCMLPALRTAALVGLTAAALPFLRLHGAAARLRVWRLVLYAALAMPALALSLPPLRCTLPRPVQRLALHLPQWHPLDSAARSGYSLPPAAAGAPAGVLVAPAARTPAVGSLPAGGGLEPRSAAPANRRSQPARDAAVGAARMPPPFRSSAGLRALLLALYIAGALLLLVQLPLGGWMARRLAGSALAVPDGDASRRLSRCAQMLATSPLPRLGVTAALQAPVTVGVWRPMILLPPSWRTWTPQALEAVLAHELAHVARRDALMQRLSMLHRALFWFSPVAWWLHAHLLRLAEAASDEAALRLGADRVGYAETLLGFFAAVRAGSRRVRWQALAMARSRGAERRVERILNWQPSAPGAGRGAVACGLGLGLAAFALVAAARPVFAPAAAPPASTAAHAVAPPLPAAIAAPARAAAASPLQTPALTSLLPPRPGCADAFDADGNPTPAAAAMVTHCAGLDPDTFAWTRLYAGRPASQLIEDSQYPGLIAAVVPQAVFHLGADMPLAQSVNDLVRGDAGTVELRGDRYLWFSAGAPRNPMAGVFFWIDLGTGAAFGAIAFNPSNGEPTPSLTLFSRQVDRLALAEPALPPELLADLARWRERGGLPAPVARYFIGGSGIRTVLPHADACAGADRTPLCRALNVDAAEVDMRAALYLLDQRLTHVADARTALDAAQARWLAHRDAACGPQAACRAPMTRARADALAALYTHTLAGDALASH